MRYRVATVDQLKDGEMMAIKVEGEPILLAKVDGCFYAVKDCCTHQDAPLSQGHLEGVRVICPHHGAQFDLKTGKALTFPAVTPVETYTVVVEEGVVYLESEFL